MYGMCVSQCAPPWGEWCALLSVMASCPTCLSPYDKESKWDKLYVQTRRGTSVPVLGPRVLYAYSRIV